MPYDEALADRVRRALGGMAFDEKRIMVGPCSWCEATSAAAWTAIG